MRVRGEQATHMVRDTGVSKLRIYGEMSVCVNVVDGAVWFANNSFVLGVMRCLQYM